MINLTKSNLKLIFRPLSKDDPKQRQPDISLAKDKLDWKIKTELDEGLKYTINYFEKKLNKVQ